MTKALLGIVLVFAAITGEPTSAADLRVLPKAPQSSRLPTTFPKDRPKAIRCDARGCTVEPSLIMIGKDKLK